MSCCHANRDASLTSVQSRSSRRNTSERDWAMNLSHLRMSANSYGRGGSRSVSCHVRNLSTKAGAGRRIRVSG